MQLHVVRAAAEENHGQVGVAIDQPGHEHLFALSVDDAGALHVLGHFAAHRNDLFALHHDHAVLDDLKLVVDRHHIDVFEDGFHAALL